MKNIYNGMRACLNQNHRLAKLLWNDTLENRFSKPECSLKRNHESNIPSFFDHSDYRMRNRVKANKHQLSGCSLTFNIK